MITKTASIAAAILAAAALVSALTHAGPRGATGAPGSPGPQGPRGVPGIAQNLDGGYMSECNQPMIGTNGNSVTYYFPCSPVPQNPADQ